MKQERLHHHDVTTASDALDLAKPLAQPPGRFRRQPTVLMRPGHDAERTTCRPAVIEVDTHGNERCEDSQRRLDVSDAALLRPSGALGMRDALLDRNSEILVQRDKPVLVR